MEHLSAQPHTANKKLWLTVDLFARHWAKPLMSMISLKLHSNPVTILQIKKLKAKEVKQSALPSKGQGEKR